MNPCFTIENWKGDDKSEVLVNGRKVNAKTAKEGNSLLVWFQASIYQETTIIIRSLK
jgi:hypothetical protein